MEKKEVLAEINEIFIDVLDNDEINLTEIHYIQMMDLPGIKVFGGK